MQRDHLFNRSTRPLLEQSPKGHYSPAAQIIQPARKPKPTTGDGYKLHGFNDFNFVANQYKNLNSTHSGYPYGSPPASPNTSMRYDDPGAYYDDDSGVHTQNSSDFSGHSSTNNYSSTNYYEEPIDGFHQPPHEPSYQWQPTHSNIKKSGGFFKDWARFGTSSNTGSSKQKNMVNRSQPWHPTPASDKLRKQQYNCNKICSIAPRPVNQLIDNGPFIFGVHSNATCYTLPAKVKNDSVINASSQAILTTKYTPIDPDANAVVENDIYSRCDTAVINDNVHSKHAITTATIANSPPKNESKRRHTKKTLDKKRIETDKVKTSKKRDRKSNDAIKCVVVGEGKVGKTNLILGYLQHRFTTEHVPTASDIYNFEVKVDERPIQVTLCDTAGQDFLDPLRRLCYPDSDVFLLCFSVIKPDTFVAVREKWTPIFRKSRTPIVLVGTQSDLRTDPSVISQLLAKNEKPVSKSDAWDYATLIGAQYIESSSRANNNVKEAFDMAIWHALVSVSESRKKPLWKRLLCLA